VPENFSQVNLILADVPGDRDRTVPPPEGNGSEMTAWADMLSRIGHKNSQLYDVLARDSKARHSDSRSTGIAIVRELERERTRIARELHAGAGQPLAGIKLNLEMLGGWAAVLPQAGRDALARMQTLAEQAIEQVRAVSHHLHPPDWQGLTTGDALRHLIESSGLMGLIEVEIDIRPLPLEPSHAVKIALYRCAQECISNVLRHSGATRFSLSLMAQGSMAELVLEDNGRGFPQKSSGDKGIGLVAMCEHSMELGGVCHISSGEDGVRIRVQLPLAAD
jgi:signal transduction histidine kinase